MLGLQHTINIIGQFKLVRKYIRIILLVIGLCWYWTALPSQLFNDSTSTVLFDQSGNLLGAHISEDEQWRFEACDSVPYKFEQCIIQFEDRNFYTHIGVSFKGLARAIKQNISNKRTVSGASTITMQVIRLYRKNPARTYFEKIKEIILATRLELSYSKEEILKFYASHAPFGNNVVGLEAASWRFYGRPPHQLSWSESATLAVLPNAPGLIYPGRNSDALKAKRNRLLTQLLEEKIITSEEYDLALLEPLPNKPKALPQLAPHLLDRMVSEGYKGKKVYTTIQSSTQTQANNILERHMTRLRDNKIYNGAIIIVNTKTGETMAYVGNSIHSGREHFNQVDCTLGQRSSGSILKPFLYAKSLEYGLITPSMFLVDIPSKFGGFSPKNFAGNYDGLIPADKALSRSLNIPMVHLLNEYGLSHFHNDLKELGLTTINKPARHYGLSLILGGAEVNLQELVRAYALMGQSLIKNHPSNPYILASDSVHSEKGEFPIDRGSTYATLNALLEVQRPDTDNNWHMFESSTKVAWKTGTSFGFRDAWAIGVSTDYTIGVWIGNADGEGRPGLVGVQAAAPVLFDLFRMLPSSRTWFKKPMNDYTKVSICQISGQRASMNCPNKRMTDIPKKASISKACSYHQVIHLNPATKLRVNSSCMSPMDMQHVSWLVLHPHIEKWYRKSHPEYQPVPKYESMCASETKSHLAIIYPRHNQKIVLPKGFDGTQQALVLEATTSDRDELVFWHLDNTLIGQTSTFHQLEIHPDIGSHTLSTTSLNGELKTINFTIVLGE